MQGWERAINTLSVRRPQPHNTNSQRMKDEKGKKQQETKSERASRPIKRHWPCPSNPPVPRHQIRDH